MKINMDSVKANQLHMQLITQLLYVVGIFIDLSKAFDTISHDKLLHKLNNHGIRGNALQLIKSYLSYRSQYVLALGENTDKLPVKLRVPQGSVFRCSIIYNLHKLYPQIILSWKLYSVC